MYISIESLQEGMIVGKDIYYGQSIFPLVSEGQVLTKHVIERLQGSAIECLYIREKNEEKIEAKELFSATEKAMMARKVETAYAKIINEKTINNDTVQYLSVVTKDIVDRILEQPKYFQSLIELKHYGDYQYVHAVNVGTLSGMLGTLMGVSAYELPYLVLAGIFHDIGYLDINSKEFEHEGELTENERNIVEQHPMIGYKKMIDMQGISSFTSNAVLYHHERYDGKGYPTGLSGEKLPQFVRILSIVDDFDSLTTKKFFRPAFTVHEAFERIYNNAYIKYDGEAVLAFSQLVASYPVGIKVRLSDGSVAYVKEPYPDFPNRPLLVERDNTGKIIREINLASDKRFLNLTIIEEIKD